MHAFESWLGKSAVQTSALADFKESLLGTRELWTVMHILSVCVPWLLHYPSVSINPKMRRLHIYFTVGSHTLFLTLVTLFDIWAMGTCSQNRECIRQWCFDPCCIQLRINELTVFSLKQYVVHLVDCLKVLIVCSSLVNMNSMGPQKDQLLVELVINTNAMVHEAITNTGKYPEQFTDYQQQIFTATVLYIHKR